MSILIFAGTSEGCALAAFLSQNKLAATVFVATEYGEQALPPLAGITVHRGRIDKEQMRSFITAEDMVIDATHPYAAQVTQNIAAACTEAGGEYVRLLRPRAQTELPLVIVPDAPAAAQYLRTVRGNVLLTTGSKELAAFTAVEDFAARIFPRVLPSASVLEACAALGYAGKNIIAMQGPFSKELNLALLRQTQAKYLVTKDSGAAGGVAEKLAAAQEAFVTAVLIARPTQETGLTLCAVKELLQARFPTAEDKVCVPRFPLFISLAGAHVVVVGAGKIAARRVDVLRRFGAKVTVIAPEGGVASLSIAREYRAGDLAGAVLAVAATNVRAVNHAVAEDCAAAGIWCSIADCAAESTFFFPAICEAGKLIAGVVSDGSDHAATARAANKIRDVLRQENATF